ncbi:hypothetical protein XELAEV_18001664mg [Xenopus laevis]|uniref:Uncharacterized protein n=1 Tax=Xenopus laevis TaxID=8355 RepID=A0A974BP68_XENLA|nr:hypothetical protein XELAEV_18001664mg [Xenopus laevis]
MLYLESKYVILEAKRNQEAINIVTTKPQSKRTNVIPLQNKKSDYNFLFSQTGKKLYFKNSFDQELKQNNPTQRANRRIKR